MNSSPIVLGIGGYTFDAAACLIKDGGIVAAVEEERFSVTRRNGHRKPFCVGGSVLTWMHQILINFNSWTAYLKKATLARSLSQSQPRK